MPYLTEEVFVLYEASTCILVALPTHDPSGWLDGVHVSWDARALLRLSSQLHGFTFAELKALTEMCAVDEALNHGQEAVVIVYVYVSHTGVFFFLLLLVLFSLQGC
jgi:hypothetical protein